MEPERRICPNCRSLALNTSILSLGVCENCIRQLIPNLKEDTIIMPGALIRVATRHWDIFLAKSDLRETIARKIFEKAGIKNTQFREYAGYHILVQNLTYQQIHVLDTLEDVNYTYHDPLPCIPKAFRAVFENVSW